MDETFEMDGLPLITSGEATEVFQAVKASFDPVSVSIDVDVVGNEDLAVTFRRDHRFRLHGGDRPGIEIQFLHIAVTDFFRRGPHHRRHRMRDDLGGKAVAFVLGGRIFSHADRLLP